MPDPVAKRLRFTRLVVKNWRNFSRIETDLQRRVFLVGPNASGKSNLLDVFRFLHDIVSIGGGFQEAVRRRGGVSSLRCLAARRNPVISISVILGTNENLRQWEYEIQFNQDTRGDPLLIAENVKKDSCEILSRPTDEDKEDRARLRQTFLEQINANKDFREISEFFESIHYLHIVPQLVRESNLTSRKENDPFGRDFIEQIARTPTKTRDARLRRIQNALEIAVPQLQTLELKKDERGVPHLRGKYAHWRPRGAWQSEFDFSDGTLRLIGLLWSLLDGSGPLLLEEPELSLHPEVVTFIPQMLARIQRKKGRQVLISTHSSDLLKDSGIGLDEIFLLRPEAEGTSVRSAYEFEEIRNLLEGGLNPAEAVLPHTRPQNASQLTLFGE